MNLIRKEVITNHFPSAVLPIIAAAYAQTGQAFTPKPRVVGEREGWSVRKVRGREGRRDREGKEARKVLELQLSVGLWLHSFHFIFTW